MSKEISGDMDRRKNIAAAEVETNFGRCIPESGVYWSPFKDSPKPHDAGVFDQPNQPTTFPYKYKEGQILEEAEKYIRSTYGQHYVGKGNVQANDIFLAQDEAEVRGFWKCNAVKYLLRYGKKNGKNRGDLLKALHYTVFLLYLDDLHNDKGE